MVDTASGALAAGWVPFSIIVLLVLIFSWCYIHYYNHKIEKELLPTVVCIISLWAVLLTALLIPADISLVSYMKESNGTFKTWAADNTTRETVVNSVLYTYYGLYALILTCAFFLVPFAYFYHEERDDDVTPSCKVRSCSAMKFTVVFVIIVVILLVVGALIPLKHVPTDKNATEWKKMEFIMSELGTSSAAQDALIFSFNCLSVVGMFLLVVYTSYGMAAWPVSLLRGVRSATTERLEVMDRREEGRETVAAIRAKYHDGRRMTSRDRQRLSELDESERLLSRQERHLTEKTRSIMSKCLVVLRPFQVVFGVFFFLLGLLVFLSLLLSNIDKALHSKGYQFGYALDKSRIPNPSDIVLVFCQQVFPLDYIIVLLLVVFFVFSSLTALRHIGIWCLCVRIYKIRPFKTRPQALLLAITCMTFIMLTMNVMMMNLAPQYATYGNQHYVTRDNTTHKMDTKPCDNSAPQDVCVMTRMAVLLLRYYYQAWFFGAAYYWATWLYVGVYPLAVVIAVIRRRRSAIDGAVDDSDFEDSDDDMLHA